MENYKSNSKKSKERERQQKVISGKATVRKQGIGAKITSELISDDSKNVKSFIFEDVIIPSLKDVITKAITGAIEMILYGDSKPAKRTSSSSRVSYRSYYDNRDIGRSETTRIRTNYIYDDILIPTREEAEEVLSRMDDIIATYGVVLVSEYYDLVGEVPKWTDNQYGWTDISNTSITRIRGGKYLLKFPKPMPV